MVNEANPNAYNSRVRTWGPPGGSGVPAGKVVATVKPTAGAYAGPSASYNNQQNIRNADIAAANIPFVSGAEINKNIAGSADAIANQILGNNTSMGGTGTVAGATPFQQALAQLGVGGGGSGSGGGGSGTTTGAARMAELQYQKQKDQIAAQINQRALQGMIDQLTSGSYRGNINDLLGQIDQMNASGTKNINDFYNTGVGNINAGYDQASAMMNQAYSGLQDYLSQHPNNPYAGMNTVSTALTNPMQNYLNMYGALSPDVSGQMQAEQLAQQGGTDAFKNLLQVLNANAQGNDLSRLAEAKMAGAQGTGALGAQKASYLSQAAQAQQSALAALADKINQAKFEQEQAAGNRYQSILDQIISAGGSLPQAQTPNPVNAAQPLPDLSGINLPVAGYR